ncbi:MAG: hypothetical protein WCO09_01615 [bacterium]
MKSPNIIKNKGDCLKGTPSPMNGRKRKFFKKNGNHQLRLIAKKILGLEDPDAMVIEGVSPGHWN